MEIERIERHLRKIFKKNEDLSYTVLNTNYKDKYGGYFIAVDFKGRHHEFWSADIKNVADIDKIIK